MELIQSNITLSDIPLKKALNRFLRLFIIWNLMTKPLLGPQHLCIYCQSISENKLMLECCYQGKDQMNYLEDTCIFTMPLMLLNLIKNAVSYYLDCTYLIT